MHSKGRFQVFPRRLRLRRVSVLAEHRLILLERHISLIQKIIHLSGIEIAAALEVHADGRLSGGLVVGFGSFRIVLLPLQRVGKAEPGQFQMG